MPFPTSEIRWFSDDSNNLWNLYTHLPERGEGARQSDRTDYYLHAHLPHTGVKIREGRHEIKVKSGNDEPLGYGMLQHWVKWSRAEENNMLNTIPLELLTDWIAVKKRRFLKTYAIISPEEVTPTDNPLAEHGCNVEFTEIQVPALNKTVFTLGFEAYGPAGRGRENLLITLNYLNIDVVLLENLESMGYPEWLSGLNIRASNQ